MQGGESSLAPTSSYRIYQESKVKLVPHGVYKVHVVRYTAVNTYNKLLVDIMCNQPIVHTINIYYRFHTHGMINLIYMVPGTVYETRQFIPGILFERSEFLIATCKKKKTDRLCVCPDVRLILVLVLDRQIVYGQNTVYLCLSKYIVF